MSEAIKLFQYNTLGALMAGLYGGTLTVGELLEKVEILSLNDHAGYGLEVVVRDLKAMGVN